MSLVKVVLIELFISASRLIINIATLMAHFLLLLYQNVKYSLLSGIFAFFKCIFMEKCTKLVFFGLSFEIYLNFHLPKNLKIALNWCATRDLGVIDVIWP